MTEWYYAEKGSRKGPITAEEIQNLLKTGNLDGESKLWKEGFADWTLLKDTEFNSTLNSPPPLTGDNVSNTIVWILAFAPVIGTFTEYMIAEFKYGNSFQAYASLDSGEYFYITLGLNIILTVLDNIMLNKAGYENKKLSGWVWLVPVYLYQRAKVTRTGHGYFWTWIGMMILSLFLSDGTI